MPTGAYWFGGIHILFMLAYLGLVFYFFFLLQRMTKSIERIANKLDKIKTDEEES